jgi:outer membrane protein
LAGSPKNAHKIALISLLAQVACLVAVHPWAQGILTLPGALRLAAKASLPADAARFDAASAREETLQVKSAYYPQVLLEGGHVNLDEQPFFKSGAIVFPSSNSVYWEYKIAARELLWDGGRRSSAVSASRTRESAIGLKGASDVRRTQAAVAESYVALLSLRAQREVVDQRRKGLQDYRRIVQDLFDQGMVARNDLLRTEVALRSVGDQATTLENTCATALEALNKDLGMDPETPQTLPDALPQPPPVPWDEPACRARAAEGNEGARALAERVKALEQAEEFQRRAYYPSVVAELSHSYQQNDYLLYPHVNALFLGVSLNVFDGGVRAAKVRQAKVEVERARRELEETRHAVSVAVGKALRDFREALKEVETARANVAASEENLRIVEDQYKEGLARTTDVLDAESVLAESRYGVVRMHYQAYARQAALLAAMGEDLPAFYEAGPQALNETRADPVKPEGVAAWR